MWKGLEYNYVSSYRFVVRLYKTPPIKSRMRIVHAYSKYNNFYSTEFPRPLILGHPPMQSVYMYMYSDVNTTGKHTALPHSHTWYESV